jgi:hypothetical protein
LLLTDATDSLSAEGRSGPKDAVVFSYGLGSYRWVYVASKNSFDAEDLSLPVSDGKEVDFRGVELLRATELRNRWKADGRLHLVQVEVNGGKGSRPNEAFVASSMRILDGTAGFELIPSAAFAEVEQRYKKYLVSQDATVRGVMAKARAKLDPAAKSTGPKEVITTSRVQWLPESQSMRVEYRHQVSDGVYSYSQGVEGLPSKQTRTGTQFGVRETSIYEVDRHGHTVTPVHKGFEPYVQELPLPR